MRFKAVVFDLDGTLADTLDDLADSMNASLAEFGFPSHPMDSYRYFVGMGMMNLARSATPEGTDDATIVRIRDAMGERYQGNWAVKTKPYDGIPAMLEALREKGLRLAVLSNKPDVFTKLMVEHFFPGVFASVAGAKEGVPIKPDPAAALAIVRDFGLEPADFMYLGDTNTDMKTGLAAGMFTIGVSWGFRPVAELEGAGAQAIIDKPAELLRFL